MSSRFRDIAALLRGRRPLGLGKLGSGSRMEQPRKIDGARHIFIGASTVIRGHGWLAAIEHHAGKTFSPSIRIGDGVYIGHYACITAMDRVEIGDGSVLSEQVYVGDAQHGYDPAAGPILEQPLRSAGPVIIGRSCFIGVGARIMAGVTLGDHCVVGANAVVTHSFPAGSVIGGVPAKAISSP